MLANVRMTIICLFKEYSSRRYIVDHLLWSCCFTDFFSATLHAFFLTAHCVVCPNWLLTLSISSMVSLPYRMCFYSLILDSFFFLLWEFKQEKKSMKLFLSVWKKVYQVCNKEFCRNKTSIVLLCGFYLSRIIISITLYAVLWMKNKEQQILEENPIFEKTNSVRPRNQS